MTKRKGAGRDLLITPAEIDDLRRKGFNQSRIAEMMGVTRSYISWVKNTYGAASSTYEKPREIARRNMPDWPLAGRQHQTQVYAQLGNHLEYVDTAGKGMSENKLYRLRLFYDRLERNNEIIEFNPEFGPTKSVGAGGFRYLQRTPDDDPRIIIRENEYTQLTDEGRIVWRLPKAKP